MPGPSGAERGRGLLEVTTPSPCSLHVRSLENSPGGHPQGHRGSVQRGRGRRLLGCRGQSLSAEPGLLSASADSLSGGTAGRGALPALVARRPEPGALLRRLLGFPGAPPRSLPSRPRPPCARKFLPTFPRVPPGAPPAGDVTMVQRGGQ